MSLYGWFCIGMLTLLITFSSLHIAEEGMNQASWESTHVEPDMLYQYADYTRNVIRTMQASGSLTSARPAYVSVLGMTSQNAGSQLVPDSPATIITAAGIRRLGMGNVLIDTGGGNDLLYIWSDPQEMKDNAKIRRSLAQGGHAVFYVRDGQNLIPGGRPGEAIPLPPLALPIIPDGATVLIQHPVE